ncbi:MAG: DUF481 domain-containing protein [Terriglobia bacterium]
MKRIIYLVICMAFLTASAMAADVVTLKSGERLLGTWENVTGSNLTLKSDTLGEVTIAMSKVKSFVTSTPAVIVEKSRTTVRGQLKLLPSGSWQVTRAGRSQEVPAASVKSIMPQATYNSLVEHHANLLHDWKGAANFGYASQRGDQQTGTITANVDGTRERPEAPIFIAHWRTNYSLLMLFSKAEQDNVEIRSDTISALLRQDYLFTPSNFVFVLGQLDHIQAQGIYLRQTYGGGLGHEVIHTSRTLFSLLGGMTFVNTKFYTGGPATQTAEALAGEKLVVALTKRISLNHYLDFYPNLTQTGQYRFDTTTNLALKLTKRISANVGLIDLYLSNPTPGNHKNNVAFTTGLGITF